MEYRGRDIDIRKKGDRDMEYRGRDIDIRKKGDRDMEYRGRNIDIRKKRETEILKKEEEVLSRSGILSTLFRNNRTLLFFLVLYNLSILFSVALDTFVATYNFW
jgi:hypothetical protein